MKLIVLSVAFPFAPVGPGAVGGAEQVLHQLDAALSRAGHQSIVIACECSTVCGTLLSVPLPRGPLSDLARGKARGAVRQRIDEALNRWPVNVIHLHGMDFLDYLPDADVPVIATLHLPLSWYSDAVFRIVRSRTHLVCVSASQRSVNPAAASAILIENGVPVDALDSCLTKRGFVAAAGRLCPEKNYHAALDAAALAGVPMLLAGNVFPYEAHQRYFDEAIKPRLSSRARFIGSVGPYAKRRLLCSARCVLAPSLVPETSSLVAMEAIACGTPVIAYPSGALAEIVQHGVTGFLVENERDMARAIRQVDAIDPEQCRRIARERFSLNRMIEQYFKLYLALAAAHRTELAMRGYAPEPQSEILDGLPNAPLHENGRGTLERSTLRVTSHQPQSSIAPTSITIEEIDSTNVLERFVPEWFALWSDDPRAMPFQSPQWLVPWWRHLGCGKLWTLAACLGQSSGGELIGLAPLFIYHDQAAGIRRVFLLGIGTSDYLDGLFAPDHAEAAAAAMLRHLAAHRDRWDECDLQQLRPDSPLLQVAAPTGFTEHITDDEPCPALRLPRSIERLGDTVPARMLENLRYCTRRAERSGTIRFEAADSSTLDEIFDALLTLHRARWSTKAQPGVLAADAVVRWHCEALPGLLAAGLLRMHAMRLNHRIVAVHYGLIDPPRANRRAYYYLGGFDPAHERLSLGSLLIGHAVREATRENVNAMDFLRGREAYKYLWGAKDTPTYRRQLQPQTAASRAGEPGSTHSHDCSCHEPSTFRSGSIRAV